MADPIRLTDWSVGTHRDDAYLPPERRGISLAGIVHGDPRRPDGRHITTSRIFKVDGRRVTTRSGTVYELTGDPEPDYLEYLKTIGRCYDPQQPIWVNGGRLG